MLIEDNPADVMLIRDLLDRVSVTNLAVPIFEIYESIELIDTDRLSTGLKYVQRGGIDVVLLDLSLSDSQGEETFNRVIEEAPEVPIVVISGVADEAFAIQAVREGAQDYLVKDQLDGDLLTRAILYAIERKQAKKALIESEQQLRSLHENAREGIFRTTPDGQFLYANPAMARIFGFDSIDQLFEVNANELYFHSEDRQAALSMFSQKEPVADLELRMRRRDGTVIWIRENAIVNQGTEGEILTYEGFISDITERKKVELALSAERERLSTTLRSITDGVIATDLELRVLLINQAAEKLTGCEKSESVGLEVNEVFHLENKSLSEKLVFPDAQKLIELEKQPIPADSFLITKNGDQRPVEGSATCLTDREGQNIGTVIVFRDITEKRQLELEMLRAAKLESIAILAGGLAHDFNNFLMEIQLNISTARLAALERPEIQKQLKDVEKTIARVKSLTRQLLTFSQGDSPLKTRTVLAPLLKESVKFSLRGTSVKPKFKIDDSLGIVEIDTGQINQVISNLVINARLATPEGGRLEVSAGNIEVNEMHPVGPLEPGRYVWTTIQDKGRGIDPDIIDKIFDPYFTTRDDGTGLGLFSCYSIIEKHGGWITATSEVGKGSTFSFYLPMVEEDIPSDAQDVQSVSPGTGRILVMDDESGIRTGLTQLLEKIGYETDAAADGKSAIEKYRESLQSGNPFDLVILDLTIPNGMGGIQTLGELKMLNPDVKAVMASGYSEGPEIAHFTDFGFSEMLVKPYTIEELSQVLKRALQSTS